jgi:hypothetical protein
MSEARRFSSEVGNCLSVDVGNRITADLGSRPSADCGSRTNMASGLNYSQLLAQHAASELN